jgi:hypothetical protein
MMPVPGIEPGLPTMALKKIKYFMRWIQTLASHIKVEDFATRPSELNSKELHLAVLVKIPIGRTNLGSSEWN